MNIAPRRFCQTCTVLLICATCVWIWIEVNAFLDPFGATGFFTVGVMFISFMQYKGTWVSLVGWVGIVIWLLFTFLFGYSFAWGIASQHSERVRYSLAFLDGIGPILILCGLYAALPMFWQKRKEETGCRRRDRACPTFS